MRSKIQKDKKGRTAEPRKADTAKRVIKDRQLRRLAEFLGQDFLLKNGYDMLSGPRKKPGRQTSKSNTPSPIQAAPASPVRMVHPLHDNGTPTRRPPTTPLGRASLEVNADDCDDVTHQPETSWVAAEAARRALQKLTKEHMLLQSENELRRDLMLPSQKREFLKRWASAKSSMNKRYPTDEEIRLALPV